MLLIEKKVNGPHNPTSQLLPIMINKFAAGMGKEGKTKEEVEEKWFVTKLCVKDGVVKDGVCKMVCQRLCVKDGV